MSVVPCAAHEGREVEGLRSCQFCREVTEWAAAFREALGLVGELDREVEALKERIRIANETIVRLTLGDG